MQQSVTNAAYNTLAELDIENSLSEVLAHAQYNQRRNLWYFETTAEQFSAIRKALQSDMARVIGERMQACGDQVSASYSAKILANR